MPAYRLLFGVLALFAISLSWREAVAQAPPPGLRGPMYFADLTAINPNTDMTLGTARMVFDTGASGTLLSRVDAQSLGLLDAAGDPVAALDSGFRLGIRNANGMVVPGLTASIGLRLSIIGKNAGGMDIGNPVFPTDEKNVTYPLRGRPDVVTLLGTNVIKELPPEQRTPGGDLRYAAVLPTDPNRTIGLGTLPQQTFIDTATGLPVNNPLLAAALPIIQNATVGSDTTTTAASLLYDIGSPYTIISQDLATTLNAKPVGTFDLFGLDPGAFNTLSQDGFLGNANPGPFTIVELTSLFLPTEGGIPLTFTNVLALENPFSTVTANLFGTNVFSNAGLNVYEDFAGSLVVAEPVPEPAPLLLLACWLGLFALYHRIALQNRRIAGVERKAALHLPGAALPAEIRDPIPRAAEAPCVTLPRSTVRPKPAARRRSLVPPPHRSVRSFLSSTTMTPVTAGKALIVGASRQRGEIG